jgi:hypothetical protein
MPTTIIRPAVPFIHAAEQELIHRLGPFCTAIAAVRNGEMVTAASGTLVSVGGRGCLLTAHHVLYGKPRRKLRGVLDYAQIGIFSNRTERQHTLPREWFLDVPIGSPGVAGEPDLAALILPDVFVSRFKAMSKAFFNLDRLRTAGIRQARVRQRMEMVLAGVPWSERRHTAEGVETKFILGHLVEGVETRRRGFTFMKVSIGYAPPARPPKDFHGVSGGGLWLVPTREEPSGALTVSGSPILAGVVFMSHMRGGVVTSLRCHSIPDIYGRARTAILRALKRPRLWTGS